MKSTKRYLVCLGLAAVLPFVAGYSFHMAGLAYDYTVYKVFVAQ